MIVIIIIIIIIVKQKVTEPTGNGGTKIEIMVPLNNLSNFWRTLTMPLIN